MKKLRVVKNGFIVLLVILAIALCLPMLSFAETSQVPPLLPGMPEETVIPATVPLMPVVNGDIKMPSPEHRKGTTEGTGTHFEITDSEYLNVVLYSSETIMLRLESVPDIVVMYLEPSSDAASAQITLGGFKPLTTYHKYEDDYHNHMVITTDQEGKYTYTQDIFTYHTVFIQPRKSTKFISDNSTGGDCASIGTWDWTTKTCTLTTDLNETVQIDSNDVTFNGNGHSMTGTRTGSGIFLNYKKNITIRNLTIKNFSNGIVLRNVSNSTIKNCSITNNYGMGIDLRGKTNSYITVENNNISNNNTGIDLSYGADNIVVSNNTISNNRVAGIELGGRYGTITDNIIQENGVDVSAWNIFYCDDTIQNNIGSGGRPIKYFNSSVNLQNEALSELILCNADYSNIDNVTIDGSDKIHNNGVYLINTDYLNVANSSSSENYIGIFLINSSNNTFKNNSFVKNIYGIYLGNNYQSTGSSNNTFTDSNVSNNGYVAITILYGSGNIISNFVVNNNGKAAWIGGSNNLFKESVVSDNTSGITLEGSGNSVIQNSILNTKDPYRGGVTLSMATNSTVNNNIIQESKGHDLYLYGTSDDHCKHTVENNIGSGERPIKYVNSAVNISNESLSELILCNADGASIDNVTIAGSEVLNNNALLIIRTDYATIANSSSLNNNYGIYMTNSTNNKLINNTFSGNSSNEIGYSDANTITGNNIANTVYTGFRLVQSNNNTFKSNTLTLKNIHSSLQGKNIFAESYSNSNTFTQNSAYSIIIYRGNKNVLKGNAVSVIQFLFGDDNTITENTLTGNLPYGYGQLIIGNSNNTKVYHNNFLNVNAYFAGSSSNLFNLAKPIGGNYWSNYDTPSEGCYDTDHDGFCDSPYVIKNYNNIITGADNLPWARQDGWNPPSDITPPATTIIQSGIPGTNVWYVSDVGITLTATDNNGGAGVKEIHYSIDGSADTIVPNSSASFSITAEGTHSLGYYAKDNSGNEETPHHTVTIKIDRTLPIITSAQTPSPNVAGWNNTNVTVTFTCNDATSGIESCQAPIEVVSEGAGQVISGTAKDFAGLTATASATVYIDKTVPVITASVSPASNSAGWHNTDVTVTFSCSDVLSGIAACPAPVTVTAEGAGQRITGTAYDKAGNSADSTVTLNIDKTPPSITSLTTNPGMLWPPNHKMVDVLINGSAADYGSGVASVVLSVTDEYGVYNMTGLSFGSTIQLEAWRNGTDMDGRQYTISAVVTDKAGNQSTATATVLVPHDMR